jgi:hypothetical protein
MEVERPKLRMRLVIETRAPRDDSRHATFGVVSLADRFRLLSAAGRGRIEGFTGDPRRLFHDGTASPFGGVNQFLADTFADVRHRLPRVGLERR